MSSKTQIIPLITSCIPQDHVESCLDCGCGWGKWAGILRTHIPAVMYSYIVGVDIFLDNLKYCRDYGSYDDVVQADIRHLPFRVDAFDVIVASEVIEHIKKAEGENFLKVVEKVSKKRVIISAPNGEWPDNPTHYKNGKVNIYENHKSFWTPKDFAARGYCVHAIGLKLDSPSGGPLIKQIISGLDYLLFPSWFIPQLGKHLVAFKDVHPKNVTEA
jgi:hypothetical protein